MELGGHDQIFNLLVARDLMKEEGLEPQVVLTVPLLVGTDGVEKMSKSLGNAIGIEEAPGEIYGKAMSIPDELMWDWLLLLSDLPEATIEERKRQVAAGTLHPKAVKQELARFLVGQFHDEAAARAAEQEFEQVFAQGGVPEDVPERAAGAGTALFKLLAGAEMASSNSEARRLVQQGAVSVDGDRLDDPFAELAAARRALSGQGRQAPLRPHPGELGRDRRRPVSAQAGSAARRSASRTAAIRVSGENGLGRKVNASSPSSRSSISSA